MLEERRMLANYTVTNTSDGTVSGPGDLPGSLRQAVFDAGLNPGHDNINFDLPSGSQITVTAVYGVRFPILINDSLTINGPGADELTISGGGSTRIFDILDAFSRDLIDVEIEGIRFVDGRGQIGGAIDSRENLTIRNSVFENNTADIQGGAIHSGFAGSAKDFAPILTILESTFTNNKATPSLVGGGGGAVVNSIGSLSVTSSEFSGNHALVGGGIASLGNATVVDSLFAGNSATQGGALNFQQNSNVTLRNLSIYSNDVSTSSAVPDGQAFGAGIAAIDSTVTIEDSQLIGNRAVGTLEENSLNTLGGGLAQGGGAVTVRRSLIWGNEADVGGGVYVGTGENMIVNSTVASNSALSGGGVGNSGQLTLSSSTVASNDAQVHGGGVALFGGESTLYNTIVADNSASSDPDLLDSGGTSTVNFSLIEDPDGHSIIHGSGNNIVGEDPKIILDSGFSQLQQDSPAVDAGNSFGLTTDQRGAMRPVDLSGINDPAPGDSADIGSYELQNTELVSFFVVNDASDIVDEIPGDGICDLGDGRCTLRAAIQEANSTTSSEISFSPLLNGIPIQLSIAGAGEDSNLTGDLDILSDVVIMGNGATNTIVDGEGLDRVFHVMNDVEAHLNGLTVRGGHSLTDGGGISNHGCLGIANSRILDNTALGNGGGISTDADVNLDDFCLPEISATEIIDNTANDAGGGVYNAGDLDISRTTIAGNSVVGTQTQTGGGIFNSQDLPTF